MGANVKEFLHLVEEFVDMVGLQMSGFQDIYEVTENLGETPPPFFLSCPLRPPLCNSTFSSRLLPSVCDESLLAAAKFKARSHLAQLQAVAQVYFALQKTTTPTQTL